MDYQNPDYVKLVTQETTDFARMLQELMNTRYNSDRALAAHVCSGLAVQLLLAASAVYPDSTAHMEAVISTAKQALPLFLEALKVEKPEVVTRPAAVTLH